MGGGGERICVDVGVVGQQSTDSRETPPARTATDESQRPTTGVVRKGEWRMGCD